MFRFTHSEPTAYVDFNMIEADGTLPVDPAEYTGFAPAVGLLVRLRDEDGNSCLAVLTSVDSDLLLATPQWETFHAADSFRELAGIVDFSASGQAGAAAVIQRRSVTGPAAAQPPRSHLAPREQSWTW